LQPEQIRCRSRKFLASISPGTLVNARYGVVSKQESVQVNFLWTRSVDNLHYENSITYGKIRNCIPVTEHRYSQKYLSQRWLLPDVVGYAATEDSQESRSSQHRIGTIPVGQIFDGGNVFRRRAQRQCPACHLRTALFIIVDLLGFNCSVRKLRLSRRE
jgi:hypothetical protein